MRLRKYTFKASGTVTNPVQAAAVMKNSLNAGPESIVQHMCPEHIHRDDIDTVADLEFVTDGDGNFSAIKVSTYDWLLKNWKAGITECMQIAAEKANQKTGSGIQIDGNMKYVGTDANLPGQFYHITERKNLDKIMKEGLIPKRGHNDWRSKKRCTYLTEAEYIVPWLGILEHMEDPIVLEVSSALLPSVEQGRIWTDRAYVPGRIYGEHRVLEPVPREALRIMSPDEVAALGVNEKAINQLMFVAGQTPDTWDPGTGERVRSEEKEAMRCMDRLRNIGVMGKRTYTEAMDGYAAKTASVDHGDAVSWRNVVAELTGLVDEEENIPFD